MGRMPFKQISKYREATQRMCDFSANVNATWIASWYNVNGNCFHTTALQILGLVNSNKKDIVFFFLCI